MNLDRVSITPMTSGWCRCLAVILVALLASLTATCGEGGNQPAGQSATSQMLLSQDDVRSVPGLETATAFDIPDVQSVGLNYDRGPCGESIDTMPTDDAIARGFQHSLTTIVQILSAETPEHNDYVSGMRANLDPGCEVSIDVVSGVATITEVAPIGVDIDDASVVAWSSTIVFNGQTSYSATMILTIKGMFTQLEVVGPSRVPQSALVSVAESAANRIREEIP